MEIEEMVPEANKAKFLGNAKIETGPCQDCEQICAQIDAETGFHITDEFERFNQRNDVYNRAEWDEQVISKKNDRFYGQYVQVTDGFRKTEGFQQKDYAIRNASWYITDATMDLLEHSHDRKEGFLDTFSMRREKSPSRSDESSIESQTKDLKSAAKFLGADLVGICRIDKRWIYTNKYSRQSHKNSEIDIPDHLNNAIIVAAEMEYEIIRNAPSALSGASTGQGYTKLVHSVQSIAQYVQSMGYEAVGSMNDTALCIPLAIQAGLGEYGRNGLLMTKEFGPRVRIGKIFTDMPLMHDRPIKIGVEEFCNICNRCAADCPPKAVPFGPPSDQLHNISNIKGVKKWSVDGEQCFRFWANINTDCSICIRVCPYNKDYGKILNRIGLFLAGTFLRKVMLKLDILLGYGARKTPSRWWNKNS